MAKLKQHITVKLEAFTLFESVVAITIIAILIGLGTMIYSNVVQAEKPLAFYEAKTEVDKLLQQLCQEQNFMSNQSTYEGFEIEQEINFYQNNKGIYQVTYTASSGGSELFREQHLLPNVEHAN